MFASDVPLPFLVTLFVLAIVFAAINVVSLILAATSVDQGVFVPMQTCATLAINLVTGLVVWEDYKVVEKWIAYIMVHCPGHTQWAHSLHCRPATGYSEAKRA